MFVPSLLAAMGTIRIRHLKYTCLSLILFCVIFLYGISMNNPVSRENFRYTPGMGRSMCNVTVFRNILETLNQTSTDEFNTKTENFMAYLGYYVHVCDHNILENIRKRRNSEKHLAISLNKSSVITTVSTNSTNSSSFANNYSVQYLGEYVRNYINNDIPIPYEIVNPHPFSYIHSPPNCSFHTNTTGSDVNTNTVDVRLMILVKSRVSSTDLREAIRQTWGNVTYLSNIRLAFMLGFNKSLEMKIDNESSQHQDIIQENFIDSYKNNTFKTIMGFNWAREMCSEADLILIVDDDHFIRITNLMAFIRTLNDSMLSDLYSGYLIKKAKVYRRKKYPWALTREEYAPDHWPPYFRGGAYLISQNILQMMCTAFPYVKYLPIDDSYLGVVAQHLSLNLSHDSRFCHGTTGIHFDSDYFSFNDFKTPKVLKETWQTLQSLSSDRFYPLHINLSKYVNMNMYNGSGFPVAAINPHPFNFLHIPYICTFKGSSRAVKLLILVKSRANNREFRHSIRKTWGNVRDLPNVHLVFLLGSGNLTDIQKEALENKDILQENVQEHWKNDTYKTIMGYNWAVRYCSDADVVLMCEEDHMVHVNNTLVYLGKLSKAKLSNLLVGYVIRTGTVNRKTNETWALTTEEYAHEVLPQYLSRSAYLISMKYMNMFTVGFPYVKYLTVDDIYIGIVAYKLNINLEHDDRFKGSRDKLSNQTDVFCAGTFPDPKDFTAAWKVITH